MNYKVVSQLYQPIFLSFSYLNSARHNLVIELCRALKYHNFSLQLFSKLNYTFLAIELLDFFSIMKYSIFIAQDNSRYLGFKNILLKLKDWGFLVFLYIKTSRQKNIFCAYE